MPVIADFENQESILGRGANYDTTRPRVRGNPVTNGVFYQRLQDQIGRTGSQHFRRDLHLHREPIAKARLLDFQVTSQKVDLFGEGHLLHSNSFECQTQQVA